MFSTLDISANIPIRINPNPKVIPKKNIIPAMILNKDTVSLVLVFICASEIDKVNDGKITLYIGSE